VCLNGRTNRITKKKSEKRLAQEAEKMRKARILLRKVDCVLKSKGIEAALKRL